MTNVVYLHGEERRMLRVSGHTEMIHECADIGCAAVSALISSLVASLQKEEEKGTLDEFHINTGKGRCIIDITPCRYDRERIFGMFDVITTGLVQMSLHYPEYVSFDYK